MKTLQKGDRGDEVIFLQRLLQKINPSLVIDGDFGSITDTMVRKFQKANKLLVDGIVGTITFDILCKKTVTNVLGTDIYRHDATDNDDFWNDLEKNYWFCFVKASQGKDWTDPRFAEHFQELKASTILRGAYHFPLLLNADVTKEVNCFLNSCKEGGVDWKEKGVLPPVYDVEPLTEGDAQKLPSQSRNIAIRMKKWLDAVETKTGRTPIIYTSKRVWDELLKSPLGFERYSLWVANYGANLTTPKLPSTWKSYAFWQFSEDWTIGGHKGFDVNRINITLKDLLKMAGY
ncbi:MAG: peptidoglycan-binding protein [Saprospiraceae bacterium]|nr:peptidoglycan-binding protein [Saprospiraceae bacterium]